MRPCLRDHHDVCVKKKKAEKYLQHCANKDKLLTLFNSIGQKIRTSRLDSDIFALCCTHSLSVDVLYIKSIFYCQIILGSLQILERRTRGEGKLL